MSAGYTHTTASGYAHYVLAEQSHAALFCLLQRSEEPNLL